MALMITRAKDCRSYCGFFLLVVITAVFYITARIWCARPQHARATCSTHVMHPSNGTTTLTGSTVVVIFLNHTHHHQPLLIYLNFSLNQLPYTTLQSLNHRGSSPAYRLHETFAIAIYSENKTPPLTILCLMMQQLKRVSTDLPTLLKTDT